MGLLRFVMVDGGVELWGDLKRMVVANGAAFGWVMEYYPEGTWMIEQGHQPIKKVLVNMCREDGKKWAGYLQVVIFADRTSTKQSTGYSP